jgi:H+/Cl- antiporter ClcA
MGVAALGAAVLGKGAPWLLGLGLGTVGGVLAPLFLVPRARGALLGLALRGGVTGLAPPLLGPLFMAAVLGAVARMPPTVRIFAVEVTGDACALGAVLVVQAVSTVLAECLLPDSVLSRKRLRRGWRVVQDAFAPCPAAGDPPYGGRTAAPGRPRPRRVRSRLQRGDSRDDGGCAAAVDARSTPDAG